MAALLFGAHVARHRGGLLLHNGVAVIVAYIGGLTTLVVPYVVTDGHKYLVILEGTVLAVCLFLTVPASQHKDGCLHAHVGLERIRVHVYRTQDLRMAQNPLAHVAQTRVAQDAVGNDERRHTHAGLKQADTPLDEEDLGRLR